MELCSALELGGLTPSLAVVEQVVAQTSLPVVVMIRPRGGGFAYSASEFAAMVRDAELALAAGAAGIVFGVFDDSGSVDAVQVRRLVDIAGGRETVFHRAFDFVADQSAALEQLIDLGVTRVLTSGGAATAADGVERLRTLVDQAGDRIEILPGGGVSPHSVEHIVTQTGCRQVHIGAARSHVDDSISPGEAASLCDLRRLSAGECRRVAEPFVAETVDRLNSIGD